MTQSHTKTEESSSPETSSIWSRAFEEMRRARETSTTPDPEVFRDLTKSAGGD